MGRRGSGWDEKTKEIKFMVDISGLDRADVLADYLGLKLVRKRKAK